jgi:hypothetical protein
MNAKKKQDWHDFGPVAKKKRGRPFMTDEQKAAARKAREAAKAGHIAPISGTARPVKATAAAPARAPRTARRGRVAGQPTKDQAISLLTQRNNSLTQELAVMRRMLAEVYAAAQQGLA